MPIGLVCDVLIGNQGRVYIAHTNHKYSTSIYDWCAASKYKITKLSLLKVIIYSVVQKHQLPAISLATGSSAAGYFFTMKNKMT